MLYGDLVLQKYSWYSYVLKSVMNLIKGCGEPTSVRQ